MRTKAKSGAIPRKFRDLSNPAPLGTAEGFLGALVQELKLELAKLESFKPFKFRPLGFGHLNE